MFCIGQSNTDAANLIQLWEPVAFLTKLEATVCLLCNIYLQENCLMPAFLTDSQPPLACLKGLITACELGKMKDYLCTLYCLPFLGNL